MYSGKIFSRSFLHVPAKCREAIVWNYSCVNALKGTDHSIQNRSKVTCKRSLLCV